MTLWGLALLALMLVIILASLSGVLIMRTGRKEC